jgi:hypothetical protein
LATKDLWLPRRPEGFQEGVEGRPGEVLRPEGVVGRPGEGVEEGVERPGEGVEEGVERPGEVLRPEEGVGRPGEVLRPEEAVEAAAGEGGAVA